jgi:hypothetical protein
MPVSGFLGARRIRIGPGRARRLTHPPVNQWYAAIMKLTVELDREVDGRSIAEVPELNILVYWDSTQDAIQRAQSAAQEIVLDRIAHGELPPDSKNAVFDVAA